MTRGFIIFVLYIYLSSGRAKNHLDNEMHHIVQEFPLLSQGLINPILASVKAKLDELDQCCLGFLTIKDGSVCQIPFPQVYFRSQITYSSNARIA